MKRKVTSLAHGLGGASMAFKDQARFYQALLHVFYSLGLRHPLKHRKVAIKIALRAEGQSGRQCGRSLRILQ